MSATTSAPSVFETPPTTARGVLHLLAGVFHLLLGPFLMLQAPSPVAALAAAVFNVGLILMYFTSGFYHRINWSPEGLARMRRLDHAMIFVGITGIYIPFGLLVLPPAEGRAIVILVIVAAALGIVRVMAWPYAPRWVAVASYTAQILVVLPFMSQIFHAIAPHAVFLMMSGFTAAGIGGLIYMWRRPNPIPGHFGFHDLFHALVVLSTTCYTVLVAQIILG